MKKLFSLFITGIASFTLLAVGVLAYEIQDLSDTEIMEDVVVGPTKIELFLDPGENDTKEIMVTNRTGKTLTFSIGTEDFTGSYDPSKPVVFLGDEKGPYILKDWLKPELEEFTLEHGQRIHLPITISAPQDAEPGGHYGAIFASVLPESLEKDQETNQGQVSIVARAGILFFVRVSGDVKEEGNLTELSLQKKFYEKGPIPFELIYENTGSVHLVPYGTIEIKNLLGKTVEEIELDPWFAMPNSLRIREVTWEPNFLFGKYTVTAQVNRGYQDIVDRKSVDFWVIPWKILLTGIMILILVIWLIFWIASRFEIKKKTSVP
ncbi:hypothetical protein ACFLYY_01935 [Patescibacteria group bacterium]